MKNPKRASTGFFWAWVDVLTCLLLVVYTLIAPPTKHAPSIPTQGVYAVTIDWPGSKYDDVDLWTQDPAGNIVYYANQQTGLMNLEHDDTGTMTSEALSWNGHTYHSIGGNHERIVVRQIIPGEYVVNIFMYRKNADGPVPVTVTLWALLDARAAVQRHVVLLKNGQEITAFRFTVNRSGYITHIDYLAKCLSCLTSSAGSSS